MVETGTILQNRYLIEEQIGEGGMGAVYLAVDQKFGSKVAIKETFYQDEDLGEAFEREAHLLNKLHHPILPHVSDYFIENGRHFLLMEYIEGEDLSEILERESAFPVEDVLRWTNELLDALDYLHSQTPPIIHRDIKPNNLKLTTRGNIVLLDFGLAKLNSAGTVGMKSVFGYSRRYSPLEQIQGTGTDARSDIFALGATVYHLLTGKPPIDVLARASAIISGKPDPLQLVSEINQEVSLPVAQVIQTALALNADRRFTSANAMRKALEYAVNSDSILSQEELTQEAIIIEEPASQISTPAESESFPALEAFAADAAQNENDAATPVQIEIPIVESQSPVREDLPKDVIVEKKAKQNRITSRHVLAIAACLAIILGGVFVFWFAANQAKSAEESNLAAPAPETTQAPDEVGEQKPVVSVPSTPKVSPVPAVQNEGQTKLKPTTKIKTVPEVEKTQVESPVEQAKKIEAPEKIQNQSPTPRPAPAQTKRRTVSQPSIVDQPAVSSIETIMTGIPSVKQQGPETRKQRREMSEAEKNQQRRRTDDILRHNRQPR